MLYNVSPLQKGPGRDVKTPRMLAVGPVQRVTSYRLLLKGRQTDHGLAAAKLEMTIPSTKQIQYKMKKEIFDSIRSGLTNKDGCFDLFMQM